MWDARVSGVPAGFSRAGAEMRVLLGINACAGVGWEGSVRAPHKRDSVSAALGGAPK